MSRTHLSCIAALFLFVSFALPNETTYAQVSTPNPGEPQALEKRLKRLEPPEPTTIVEPPWEAEVAKHYPVDTVSVSEVIDEGTEIPFHVIKDDPSYKRPVYEEHWHSTYWGGRWSYVPVRIQYALHRLFTMYDIGISAEFDFKQNLGIDFPTFQNKTDLDLYIVVFQTDVTNVYNKGNQVVVVGTPARDGVQVITVKTGDLKPSDLKKLLLVQLATHDGHELDYSLISYQPPDFWQKQIQKAQER